MRKPLVHEMTIDAQLTAQITGINRVALGQPVSLPVVVRLKLDIHVIVDVLGSDGEENPCEAETDSWTTGSHDCGLMRSLRQ